jgi:hypothetical protein
MSSHIPNNKVTAIAIATFSFLGISYVLYRRTRLSAALPPGPPPLPIVGNVLHMPEEQPWLKYAEWAKQYGEAYLTASQIFTHNPLQATLCTFGHSVNP